MLEVLKSKIPRTGCLLVVTALLLIFPGLTVAETPLTGEEAYTLPYGVQVELETRFSSTNVPGGDFELFRLRMASTFSISDRWDFLLDVSGLRGSLENPSTRNTGIGDIHTGVKYLISREGTNRPAISLLLDLKFGTADERGNPALGSGEEDVKTMILISKKLNGRTELGFNAGYVRVGADFQEDIVKYTLSLTQPIDEYNFFMAEVFGNTNVDPASGDDPVSLLFGFRHLTARKVKLNIAAIAGLTDSAKDFEGVLSLGYDF